MKIDDSIARDFVRGDITAKAFKSYLAPLLSEEPSTNPTAFAEECKTLLTAAEGDGFAVDDWEHVFLSDNADNTTPSIAQIKRLEKISRRYNQHRRR